MTQLLLLAALVAGVFWLFRHFNGLDQAGRKQFWKRFAFAVVFGVVLLLTATGRLHYIAAVVTGVLPFVKKLLPALRYLPFFKQLYQQSQASQSPGSGQQSSVETSLLKMELDHATASLDGVVCAGTFEGKRLSELSQPQLIELYEQACAQHRDSVELLEAYLQRELGDEWQQYQQRQQDGVGAASSQEPSLMEAYEILGVEEGATRDEIIQAHRRLMQKFHPDRGGNDFLAAQINQAKNILLRALDEQ